MKAFINPLVLKLRRSGTSPTARQTGDTIVEVMVSMTILALVLGVAFVTSRHSFQDGLDSSYRDQAQAYAEQQAELIKQLDSSGALSSAYQGSAGFCINPTTQAAVALVNGSCPLPVGSSGTGSSQYTLVDKYDSARMKYTVQVQWPSSNSSVSNSVTLQYKPSNSFVTTPGSFSPPVSTTVTQLNGGWPTMTTDWSGAGGPSSPSVPYGTSLHVTWSTVPTAQSCSGSTTPANLDAGWNGSKAISGSYAAGPLTANVTYNLSCNPFGGGAAQQSSVAIAVSAAPAPTVVISPTSQTINNGSAAAFSWSTSAYTTSCSASGSWSGAKATSGSYNTGGLSGPATYTYYLSCSGPGGTSPTVSASVAVNGPPVINYFYPSPSSICYGCGTTLYWGSSNTTSCTWGGSSGAVGTGALYGNTGYTLNCYGPGGSTSSYTVVYVSPPPPPPPPPNCSAYAGGSRSGPYVTISGGGSGCGYYEDSYIGWNGGGTWGPIYSPGTFCHTQSGGTDPWGWISSQQWCG